MNPYCYKLTIAYDGRNYSGWQIQPNGLSIQEIIQNKIAIILKEKIIVHGSGRTDAKVHAMNQTAHFHISIKIDERRFLHSLNALLPMDIRIKSIEEMPFEFHARYKATGKIYHYHIYLDRVIDPFKYHYRWHVHQKLDLESLRSAAKLFLGTHDFTSFTNETHKGTVVYDSIRTLLRLDVILEDGGIRLEFEGDGFLYKMVRNITGFLVEVAKGKRSSSEISYILQAKDRTKSGPAAPPQGLFLMDVLY